MANCIGNLRRRLYVWFLLRLRRALRGCILPTATCKLYLPTRCFGLLCCVEQAKRVFVAYRCSLSVHVCWKESQYSCDLL